MTKPTYAVIDFETGGLSYRVNPPVSISVIVADSAFQIMTHYYTRLMPPAGTALQIPTYPVSPGDFRPIPTKELVRADGSLAEMDSSGCPKDGSPFITATAAAINGFNWADWNNASLTLPEADETLSTFLQQAFGPSTCVAVAHNAPYDQPYLDTYLPKTSARVYSEWFCTLKASRDWRKKTGKKGGCKLVEMAALINDWPGSVVKGTLVDTKTGSLIDKAHDALVDTKLTLALLTWINEQRTA